MVNLGFMLPTDETHENKIKAISEYYEIAVETILNDLIDKAYKEMQGEL